MQSILHGAVVCRNIICSWRSKLL